MTIQQLSANTGKSKPLSSLAQLVAILMQNGITTTRALMAATGKSERSIWRAKAENKGAKYSRVPNTAGCQIQQGRVPQVACQGAADGTPERASENVVYNTTGATKESSSKILYLKKVEEESPFIPQDPEKRISCEKGRIKLGVELDKFWLEQFGSDRQRLDLALIQAAAYVQPNSFRPLEAQVGSQLARIAADRRDRDSRYAKAAQQNRAAPGYPQAESGGARVRRLLAAQAAAGEIAQ